MPDLTILQRAVADVSRQIRVRRAEFYGLRGLFGGALAALLPLVLRDSLGWSGFLWAGGCLAVGAAVGAVVGYLMALPPGEAARLADRGYGFQTASPPRSSGPTAPTAPRLRSWVTRWRACRRCRVAASPRRISREARFVPALLALGSCWCWRRPSRFRTAPCRAFRRAPEDEEKLQDRTGPRAGSAERRQARGCAPR
jgi:hypothetical protein